MCGCVGDAVMAVFLGLPHLKKQLSIATGPALTSLLLKNNICMRYLGSYELSLLHNYFCPSVKLIDKQRVKAKTIKVHDVPKTPFQRIIESSQISNEVKDALRQKQEQLDPFKLKKDIERKLKHIFTLVNVQTGSKRKAI